MVDLQKTLEKALEPAARDWLAGALDERARDPARLPVLFPQLPRRLGRAALGGGRVEAGGALVDLDAFRLCDVGAYGLLAGGGPGDAELLDLYAHGDMEERTMVLRALGLLPVTDATARLLEEVQRTNMVLHVEAAVCDTNLLARAVGTEGFGIEDFNRMVLKLAFLDLPLERALGAEAHANEELSRMLQGLATEREAAGRAVWRDTDRMLGRAPVAGSLARLLGGLEHGDDGRRLAAAEGLLHVVDAGGSGSAIVELASQRVDREPRPAIRAVLERIVSAN